MKTLILMRHAKAVREDIPDMERHLEERGIKDSKKMGKFLKHEKMISDVILCSPSKRTKQTLELVLEELKTEIPVRFEPVIYENDNEKIKIFISSVPNEIQRLMVIGHNPSIETLAEKLSGEVFPEDQFSTAGIAILEFDFAHWKKIKKQTGKLVLFKSPKML